jgi:hypothetical protein
MRTNTQAASASAVSDLRTRHAPSLRDQDGAPSESTDVAVGARGRSPR